MSYDDLRERLRNVMIKASGIGFYEADDCATAIIIFLMKEGLLRKDTDK